MQEGPLPLKVMGEGGMTVIGEQERREQGK